MLPGIRAVTIAIIAALGLLIGAFALAAALRVAQESRSGQLRADLAQRGRALVAANSEPRAIVPVEKPPPLEPNPIAPVEVSDAPEIPPPVVVRDASEIQPVVVAEATQTEPPAIESPPVSPPTAEVSQAEPPPAEPQRTDPIAALLRAELPPGPPIGGPLPEQAAAVHAEKLRNHAAERAAAKKKAKHEALKKVRAARLARIARARKAAVRKERARARASQQAPAPTGNQTFGSFGNFGNSSFGSNTFRQ
jgi:hypothetical protein